jgi:lipoprotein signal peptidase
MPGGDEQMSRKKMTTIALFIGAVIVLAGGAFALLSDHMKTGYGLLVLGVILIGVALFTFFRPSNERAQLDREWM